MTTEQPEALRLADAYDVSQHREVADELRRQHAEIERLTAENSANMQTCKGVIAGLTTERDQAHTLLRQAVTALCEYTTPGNFGGRVPIDAALVAAIRALLPVEEGRGA